jgi:hypothetical protein
MDPEHESIESFVQFCLDDEVDTFTAGDVDKIAQATKTSHHKVREELETYGLCLARRAPEKSVRGFQTNSNDRYYGKGSERTHGGSGWEQINGFGGQEG